MSGAYCKKHDEFEPCHWDSQNDGLWVCPGCSRENMKRMSQPGPDGRKPLDVAIEKIQKEYPHLLKKS